MPAAATQGKCRGDLEAEVRVVMDLEAEECRRPSTKAFHVNTWQKDKAQTGHSTKASKASKVGKGLFIEHLLGASK